MLGIKIGFALFGVCFLAMLIALVEPIFIDISIACMVLGAISIAFDVIISSLYVVRMSKPKVEKVKKPSRLMQALSKYPVTICGTFIVTVLVTYFMVWGWTHQCIGCGYVSPFGRTAEVCALIGLNVVLIFIFWRVDRNASK